MNNSEILERLDRQCRALATESGCGLRITEIVLKEFSILRAAIEERLNEQPETPTPASSAPCPMEIPDCPDCAEPDAEMVERVAWAIKNADQEFRCNAKIPHRGRHLAKAAIAAMRPYAPVED